MREIIHSYKLRLTNLSQGNRSLKLARLSRRRDIDWRDLGFLEKDGPEEMLARLISGKDLKLINRLDPRHEPTNLADRRLNNIYREVNTLFEETGTHDLFVGYPFVEGKFVDGTIARCPVLLFPVRLIRNLKGRPRWTLESLNDEPILFNKTFFLAYEQFQQQRIAPAFWEEEIERGKDWIEWLNSLYQKIKEYELEVNFNARLFDKELTSFREYSTEALEGFGLGKLIFQPQAVLGIFPQSDSALLQDYQQIEADLPAFSLERYFPAEEPGWERNAPEKEERPDYIREEERYFVTQVDQSQEEALLRIKRGHSLVIHGPPGTGKSQVIVNIIADAMAHGKKVLLVSQKRAALDVVYKRLGSLGLSRFAVLVHDYRHDRKDIYRKIKRQIDDIDLFKKEINDLNVTKWEHDYKLLSRQVDQYTRTFDGLYEALSASRECGLSIHELYLRCDAQAEILPLAEVARSADMARLDQLLGKLHALLDYADLLSPAHPWQVRLSFQHYSHDDRQRIGKLLGAVPAQAGTLHQAHNQLQTYLGKEMLDPGFNRKVLDQYRQIEALLATPAIRQDIEAIYADELKPALVKNKLEQIDSLLDSIEEVKLLKDFSWRLYTDLDKHLARYDKQHKQALRVLSIPYLRARWFLSKLLEPKGIKLNKDSLKVLKSEFKLFRRLHSHYSKVYEYSFFEDFPLLDDLDNKQNWIIRKRKHFEAFQKINGLKALPALHPAFSFGKLKEEKWADTLAVIQQLQAYNQQLSSAIDGWSRYLATAQVERLTEYLLNPEEATSYCEQLEKSLQADFGDLKSLDSLLGNFTGMELKAFELLFNPERLQMLDSLDRETFIAQVRNSIYFHWIELIEKQNPVLEQVSGRGWPRQGEDYARRLSHRRDKVAELIRRRIKERIVGIITYNRLRNPVTYRQVYHQVSKKRRLWSVRRLVSETWESGLPQLAPCWMASPESVAAIFPMQKDFFDVVIFDEASQCFVERAIPVMLRAPQSVIAGDEQQLRPFDLYQVKYEEAESEFIENAIALEVESILDLAKRNLSESKLLWHYRSKEEELINFSNHAFYEGKLQVIPPARPDSLNHPPLEWISVNGLWQNNRNMVEAERVIDLVLDLIRRPDRPSIGVVTFNFQQQELIKDRMDARLEYLAGQNENLYQRLQLALQQREEGEFQGIFVKNIENVQGDERDIIIFSVGYARNEAGKLMARFGLLNQKGGANRLNVAISRARRKVYIVCSFQPGDLKVQDSIHDGPRFFKAYLQYGQAVSDGREQDALRLLNLQNEEDIGLEKENPIADALAEYLEEKGYLVLKNFGDTAYKLDIAVRSPTIPEDFILGIECEGPHYFSGVDSKEREVYRRALLETRGWKVHRIWARNWWKDRDKELEKVLKMLPSV